MLTSPDTVKYYDFFILQSTTAAGQALNEFLRVHPRLFLPPRELVDKRFIEADERRLLLKSPKEGDFPPWPNDYVPGFMLHDSIQVRESIPGRVASLLQPGAVFIQLVRDPIDAVWAQYKRYAEYNALQELARLLGKDGYLANHPFRTVEQVYRTGKEISLTGQRMRYFAEGERFFRAHNYARWEVVDAKELLPDRVDGTMQRLADYVGVPAFSTPLYKKNFHGTLQKLLGFPFSHFVMNAYGYELPVILEQTPNVPFAAHGFRLELCRGSVPVQVALQSPTEPELSLCTSFDAWFALPEKLRVYLAAGPVAEFMANAVLPAWRGYVEMVRQRCEELLVEREVPESLVREMHGQLGHDLDNLIRRIPSLEGLWTSWFSEGR